MSKYNIDDVVKVLQFGEPYRIVGVYQDAKVYRVCNVRHNNELLNVWHEYIVGLWDEPNQAQNLTVPDENGKVAMTAPYGQLTPEEVLQCLNCDVVLEKLTATGWERVRKPLEVTAEVILNVTFRKYNPIKINDVNVEPPLNYTGKPYMGYTISLHTRKVVMIRIADGQVGWACFDQAYNVLKAILAPLGIQPVDKESNLAELWCKS